MRQLKATKQEQSMGLVSLHVRVIGRAFFIKGNHIGDKYVRKFVDDLRKKGAVVLVGNGGWIRADIVGDNNFVKLGDVEFHPKEIPTKELEGHLFDFLFRKYKEAGFIVQEVVEI